MLAPALVASQRSALSEAPIPIVPAWRDEMSAPERWHSIGGPNPAIATTPATGLLTLALGPVPSGWPYEYQWSGLTQDGEMEFHRDTVLLARLLDVRGYAHLDLELLDDHGKPGQSFRSTTLFKPGVCRIDFGSAVFPAQHKFRVRLIVGGPNAGCSATYDWIRFVDKSDADRLAANPNLPAPDRK